MRSLFLGSVSVALIGLFSVACGDSTSDAGGGGNGGSNGTGADPSTGGTPDMTTTTGMGGDGGSPPMCTDPPAEWGCMAEWWSEVCNDADEQYCDCDCGALDPDCGIAELPITCDEGQTCEPPTGVCTGLPAGWTCDEGLYDGGVGNGCDCNCGAPDPDCDLADEVVAGCEAGEVCPAGSCIPDAWTCEPTFYGDAEFCDCVPAPGCGIQDIDCDDPKLPVFGCEGKTDTCVAGTCTPP